MLRFTKSCSNHSIALKPRTNSKLRMNAFNVFFVSTLLLVSGVVFGQAADLDQGENGSATSPKTIFWQNGNLGPSGAHFAEGYSIPYRMRISNLTGGVNAIHTLVIEWDTKDQNGHALDYITHYDNLDNPVGSHQANFGHAKEAVDPTAGTAFSGAPLLYQIPTPSSTGAEIAGMPGQSFTELSTASRTNNPDATKMAIWGGTIVDFLYLREDNQDATTASTKTQLRIRFRSNNGTTALLAWGGHIAAEYDWGVGRGASKVSGSPYHMRLISIDGKGGNQDRSLKASAVLVPTVGCVISAAQPACEGTSGPLTYSVTGSPSGITNYSWTLTFNATNARISGGTNTATTSTISGANVTSISVVPAAGTTFAPGTYTVSLTLTNLGGAGTPCTQTGTISPAATANAGADQPVCASSPDVTLNGSVGGGASSGVWSGGTGTFNPNANTLNATYTPSAAEITAGTVTLTLTTNDPTGPCGTASDQMVITINPAATANAGGDQTVCASDPDVILAGSVGGSATSGVWSGGTGTFNPNANTLNATYTPSAAEISSGTVTLTLTTNDPTGPCGTASDQMVISITDNPDRPIVTYQGPACNETTFSVTVVDAVAGGSYTLTQDAGGVSPIIKTTAVHANGDGDIVFSGLTVGKGFSIILTVNNCTSDATDCSNYTTPVSSAITQSNVQKAETVNAKIESQQSKVLAAPNPFSSKLKFNLESAVSGQGSLELYNMNGQKVKTVYQGYVKKGEAILLEYNVPSTLRTNLIYIFRVGDQQVTGKLIGIK